MISHLKVYKATSLNPYENLAIEEYLLGTVENNALYLYLWQNENTVVIGRNQNPWAECNCELLRAEGGFVARRLSGGGAVFHDSGNLNFTFISSEENYSLNANLQIIKKACEYAGIPVELSGRNDILTNGKKFSGNAFYHSKGKAYHHGTLLISSKNEKIKRYLTPKQQKLSAKGVKSVEARVVNLNQFNPNLTPSIMADYLIKAAEVILNLQSSIVDLPISQEIKDHTILLSSWDYIYGKTPPFSVSANRRFLWGDLEIKLNLSGGKIAQIKVFTDALDFSIANQIETALKGVEFKLSPIEAKLQEILSPAICTDTLSVIKDMLAK